MRCYENDDPFSSFAGSSSMLDSESEDDLMEDDDEEEQEQEEVNINKDTIPERTITNFSVAKLI